MKYEKGREKFEGVTPRIISDNGSQFIAKEFKVFISQTGMTHVTTAPYYPQSNGKLERCNKTVKHFLKTMYIADYEDGVRSIDEFINYYNNERLHSAIGYVTPNDKLHGREESIFAAREEKLEKAREQRRLSRSAEVSA